MQAKQVLFKLTVMILFFRRIGIFGMILLFSSVNRLCAQTISISSPTGFNAFVGINNELTIMAENLPCNRLSVTTDNGTITSMDQCHYVWSAVRIGSGKITVVAKAGSKKISMVRTFTVSSISLRFSLLLENDSTVLPEKLLAQSKPILRIDSSPYIFCDVVLPPLAGYFVTATRQSDHLFTVYNAGHVFTGDLKTAFVRLQSGDVLTFHGIKVLSPYVYNIPSVDYRIR